MPLGSAFGTGFQAGSQAVSSGLALKQKEEELKAKKQQQRVKDYQARVKAASEQLDKAVKGAYATSPNPEEDIAKIKASSEGIIKRLGTEGQLLGNDPEILQRTLTNIFSQPSPAQLAEQEAQKAGTIETEKGKAKGDLTTFVDKAGTFHSVRSTDKEAIDDAIKEGWVKMPATFVSDKPPKVTGRDIEEAGAAVAAMQGGAAAIKALHDVPGAVGLPGAITDNIGGFFGSIGMKTAEKAISHIFSGDDPEKVKAARSKFITFQGSMARAILNDTRISDYERKILNDAIGATGPNASSTALIGAYKGVLAASTTLARRKQLEAGKDILDLNKPEDINSLGQQLVNAGLTNKDAVDVLKQIKDIEAIHTP